MPTITLPEVETTAQSVLSRLNEQAPRTVVVGPPSSGKTSVLHSLALTLGHKAVLVEAPSFDPDAGPVALAMLCVGLTPGSSVLVDSLRSPSGWAPKKNAVLAAVRARADETVVLIDEPFANSAPGPVAPPFGRRLAELTKDLLAIDGLRVVWTASDWTVPGERLSMRVRSNPDEILDPSLWNGERPAAEQVSQQPRATLESLSPLELRLRVALVKLGVPPADAVRRRSLGATLALLLNHLGAQGSGLQEVLKRLSVLRVPLSAGALVEFGAGELDPDHLRLLERSILFGSPAELRLHSGLAEEVRRGLSSAQVREAHTLAARYHKARFGHSSAAEDVGAAVRHELENLHHRTEAGDATLLQEESLWFSDQYVGLGRALSLAKRHPEAVIAYERAVEHDDDDAYAHHYLAWNLDVEAADPLKVEQHYRRAIELEPSHAWYQGRFINHLITRGRTREAKAAWEEALAEIYAVFPHDDRRIHEELHAETARLLLHRGQLAFAREVLDDVPGGIDDSAWLRAERRLLHALEEAEQERLVHPAHVPDELRASPVLFDPTEVPPGVVWMPGRVANLTEGICHLRVLRVEPPEPKLAWLHLPFEHVIASLDGPKAVPPAGTFIEIIEGAGGTYTIRRHPRESFYDDALPRLDHHASPARTCPA
jgi:tetratricopeptide (TPR) repeat protein